MSTPLTPQQEADFNNYGCASASLIRLCTLRDRPISKEDFVAAHSAKFQFGQCGRLTIDKICEIAMGFGWFQAVYFVRDPLYVRGLFRPQIDANVLVLTDRKRDIASGRWVSDFHCSLALEWRVGPSSPNHSKTTSLDEVLLFSPDQMDHSAIGRWFPYAWLEEKLVHFLVLS